MRPHTPNLNATSLTKAHLLRAPNGERYSAGTRPDVTTCDRAIWPLPHICSCFRKDYVKPAATFSILGRYLRQAADACVALARSMLLKLRTQTKRQHCAGIAHASHWAYYYEGNALQTLPHSDCGGHPEYCLLQECGQ